MLIKDGLPDAATEQPGLLRLARSVPADRLSPLPRYVYSVRLPMAEARSPTNASDLIDSMLGDAGERPYWRTHLDWDEAAPAPYRFSIEGRKASRDEHQAWLRGLRIRLAPLGAVDVPSAYVFEIVLSWRGDQPRLFFRAATGSDPRFRYRLRDVGAGMNPVVAATLARLVPWPLPGAVIDPTCGSGTLLFERGILTEEAPLIGIDISGVALDAARTNGKAIGFSNRTEFRKANAAERDAWSPCGVVLANLPFGIRTGRDDPNLAETYRAILANAAHHLAPGGRVLLASANRGGLDYAIAGSPLHVFARQRVQSGGLFIQVIVLGHKPSPHR
ncbi:MAG: methyltransferase domain-containing protein [Sphingomonas sp.]